MPGRSASGLRRRCAMSSSETATSAASRPADDTWCASAHCSTSCCCTATRDRSSAHTASLMQRRQRCGAVHQLRLPVCAQFDVMLCKAPGVVHCEACLVSGRLLTPRTLLLSCSWRSRQQHLATTSSCCGGGVWWWRRTCCARTSAWCAPALQRCHLQPHQLHADGVQAPPASPELCIVWVSPVH